MLTREGCYMSFSEALEKYLDARDAMRHFGPGRNRDDAEEEMQVARDHMDALTNSTGDE